MRQPAIEQHRREMLRHFAKLRPKEGAWPSPVPGVTLIKNTHSYPPVTAFYEPCIVIVAQGMKRFHFPDAVLTYDAQHYLLVTVPVPASCEAVVDDDGPFFGLAVRIDLQVLADMVLHSEQSSSSTVDHLETTISAPAVSEDVMRCGACLLQAMLSPSDAAILGPLLLRELHYYALIGPAGGMMRALLSGNTGRQRIHRVLETMHTDFAAPFQVEHAARDAGMSVSAFHEHFRKVTGSSPLHYLKQLRLHRARTLMVQTEISASAASEQVGYLSQSQFSREFKREFGKAPLAEIRNVRKALHLGRPHEAS